MVGQQVHFTVPMAAVGWKRARKNGNQFFVDAATKGAEAHIATIARQAMRGLSPFLGPVKVSIVARYTPPASWANWRREYAMEHQTPKATKPDFDNIAKLVGDACNGIVWADDAQIAHCDVDKTYGRENILCVWAYPMRETPRLRSEVRI